MTDPSGQIDHVLIEDRKFPPSAEFTKRAVFSTQAQYDQAYAEARDDRDGFWKAEANEHLHWFKPFGDVCQWKAPHAKWFVGGHTNASYNCLDRNIDAGRGDKAAIIWEGEPGETRTLTYKELRSEVAKCAAALDQLGIKAGDVVSMYMPMTPELPIAMLACARIGAVHSRHFRRLQRRIDCRSQQRRRRKTDHHVGRTLSPWKSLPLKETVDEAFAKSPTVKHCLVLRRTGAKKMFR